MRYPDSPTPHVVRGVVGGFPPASAVTFTRDFATIRDPVAPVRFAPLPWLVNP